jgi:hypothetical protein
MAAPDIPYFPVKHGTYAFASQLEAVRHHRFSSTPLYCQGFLSRDVGPDRAEKEFLAVNHYPTFIEKDILESKEDRHLYELVTERTAVRPYVDLEWDPTQLDERETLKAAITLLSTVLEEHGAQGRGLSIYCASSKQKASYHVLFDTVQVFRNAKELGGFLHEYVMPRVTDALRYGQKCVIDTAPYGSSQSFRLPYQSKWKSWEARRFLPFPVDNLIDHTWVEAHVATIGVYERQSGALCLGSRVSLYHEPVAAWLIDTLSQKPINASRPIHSPIKGVHSPEYDKVAELTRFLSPTFLQGYKDAMNLIFCLWNVEQTDRMHDLIHATCQRANNYEYRWVQNLIRSWKYSAFSVGSLVVWATAGSLSAGVSKDAVSAVLKRFAVTYQNELFDRSMVPSRHTTIHERYVPPLIFENSRTIILQSHLGTGKTVAISEMIQYGRYERILIVSPRKSYTYSQIGALRQAAGTAGSTMPLFESYLDHSGPLGHLPYLILQAESLWRIKGAEDYDLVIMDESESILCQMHSVVTHGPHMIDNHVVLETVLRGALRAVFADAFVSDRTFHAVQELRQMQEDATHFIENTYQPYDRTAIALVPIHKDKRVANLGALCERIMEALKADRKIVVLWTSKKRGLWFAKQFLANTAHAFYHSGSSAEDVAGLRDVSTTWRDIQCLMMTTSITVGLSYDPKIAEAEFDEAFLYGSSASAIPRDIAQSLLRVRVLKANRLTYVLETRVASSQEKRGFRAVAAALTAKEQQLTQRHPLVTWATCPVWARYNHCYNINEERISRMEYREILQRYMILSGYALREETHVPEAAIGLQMELEDSERLLWDNIDDINYDVAQEWLAAMKKGEATPEMVLQYKKAVFRMQLCDNSEDDCKALWTRFYGEGHEGRFWNVVKERRQTATSLAWEEAGERYGIMAKGTLKARDTMGRFLEIVGLPHSQATAVFSHERLVELAGPLEAAEKELREGMGLRATRRKGAWVVTHTIDLIRVMLETWGCSVVESEIDRKQKDRSRQRDYTLHINPNNKLWKNIMVYDVEHEEYQIVL